MVLVNANSNNNNNDDVYKGRGEEEMIRNL